MCLRLGPIKHDRKGPQTTDKRTLIYSWFLARDTWSHMTARINKGHAQFNSRPRLEKQVFFPRIAREPTSQPTMKFSQLIFLGVNRV